jgi:putative hemolysin
MPTTERTAPISPALDTLRDLPHFDVQDFKYIAHFATTAEQIEAALKLRFEVFNLELGEGLAVSFQTGRDRDEFDATCHHLLVTEKASGSVVGTYRLRTLEMTSDANGFYSAAEFDLTRLPPQCLHESVELGRACIAQSHRNRQVLFLLWRGLAAYMKHKRKRYAFGCCSLTSQNPAEGVATWHYLKDRGFCHEQIQVPVIPEYECRHDEVYSNATVHIPRLFVNYLAINAKVVSPPAIDRRFKTIDFLVLLDVEAMDPRTRDLFFE